MIIVNLETTYSYLKLFDFDIFNDPDNKLPRHARHTIEFQHQPEEKFNLPHVIPDTSREN